MLVDPAELGLYARADPSPPVDLTAAQGGVVLAEAVRADHLAAWLLAAAGDGHIDIDLEGPHPVLRRSTVSRASGVDTSTAALLEHAFGDRDELPLDGYDPRFAEAWSEMRERLERWERDSGYWDPAGDVRQTLVRIFGIPAGPFGLFVIAIGLLERASSWWTLIVLTGAAVAGAGIAAVVRSWELRIRTPAGSDRWLRVEGSDDTWHPLNHVTSMMWLCVASTGDSLHGWSRWERTTAGLTRSLGRSPSQPISR